jgi:hypothetical protein
MAESTATAGTAVAIQRYLAHLQVFDRFLHSAVPLENNTLAIGTTIRAAIRNGLDLGQSESYSGHGKRPGS